MVLPDSPNQPTTTTDKDEPSFSNQTDTSFYRFFEREDDVDCDTYTRVYNNSMSWNAVFAKYATFRLALLCVAAFIHGIRSDSDDVSLTHRIVPHDTTETATSIPPTQAILRRHLAVGDFEALNRLIKDMRLQLQDQTISAGQLDLTVSNLQCQNIQIGDILLDYRNVDGTTLE